MSTLILLNIISIGAVVLGVSRIDKRVQALESTISKTSDLEEEYKTISNQTIKKMMDSNLDRIAVEQDGELYDCYIENRKIEVDSRLKNILVIGKQEY